MKMAAPATTAGSFEQLDVTGRKRSELFDQSFSLGAYKVTDVKRSVTSSSTATFGAASRGKASSRLQFKVSRASKTLDGECQNRTNGQSVDTGSWILNGLTGSSRALSLCTCSATNNLSSLEVTPENSSLLLAGRRYPIDTVYVAKDGFKWPTKLGFSVGGQSLLATVETVHPGRAWINQSIGEDQREHMACLLVALMLNRPAELDLN